jgi:NAD(P)-dependent dehydrogenase (short-subunit alcohol dehydrogenase family)
MTTTTLITGAAGHLGQAVAHACAARGDRLVLLGRHAKVLHRLYGANSEKQLCLACDLLDPEQVADTVQQTLARFGRIDALCHLAGGFVMGEAVHATPPQTLERMLDLNVRSLLTIAASVVPVMAAAGWGHIVTVGATAALHGGAGMGAYAASKSALMRLTESMSAELKGQGIHVNCVLPSIIDTPDNRAAMPTADPTLWVAPQALADVILFLTSDAARAIHGACIPVTGRV